MCNPNITKQEYITEQNSLPVFKNGHHDFKLTHYEQWVLPTSILSTFLCFKKAASYVSCFFAFIFL